MDPEQDPSLPDAVPGLINGLQDSETASRTRTALWATQEKASRTCAAPWVTLKWPPGLVKLHSDRSMNGSETASRTRKQPPGFKNGLQTRNAPWVTHKMASRDGIGKTGVILRAHFWVYLWVDLDRGCYTSQMGQIHPEKDPEVHPITKHPQGPPGD